MVLLLFRRGWFVGRKKNATLVSRAETQTCGMTTVVIGAGLAGLAVARALRRMGDEVVVLESSARVGGRIRTVYDEQGTVATSNSRLQYESGPWRVPSSHARVRALFADARVALLPCASPPLHVSSSMKSAAVVPGLEVWDVQALQYGPSRADAYDRNGGYADQTHCASGSTPYTTAPGESFYVAPAGFSEMIRWLSDEVGSEVIRTDVRVVDLTRHPAGGYSVHCVVRVGHNSFESRTIAASRVAVCVPPRGCASWSLLREHARSVLHAVEEGALHHVYVRASTKEERMATRGMHFAATPLLAQTVGTQYPDALEGSYWYQASYSGGRIAWLWHRLSMVSRDHFLARLRDELYKGLGIRSSGEVRSHHWSAGYHTWRAAPDFRLEHAVACAVRPNPMQLPNVVLANEAWSSHQAWMEGALEMAERAVEALQTDWSGSSSGCAPCVYVEGWPVKIDTWSQRHPGGRGPLENHVGEDVTRLMLHIGHSTNAWAAVHSLKCATTGNMNDRQ